MSIGCAVVGFGGRFAMGMHHAKQVMDTPGLHLAAVYDIDPERRQIARQELPEVTIHDTYDAVLADASVDMVILVTPHDTHAPMSIAASKAGKHVLTEKVMCLNVAEADAMIAAAREAGRMLSVYQNRRWDHDYLTVRKVIAAGLLGEVFQIDSSVNGWWAPPGWRGSRAAGGGMLYDWGAHLFDQVVQMNLPSLPTAVFASRAHRVWMDVDVDTQNSVMVLFDNGVTACIDVGCISRTQRSRWLVRGDKGALHMPDWDTATAQVEVNGVVGSLKVEMEKGDWNALYRNVSAHLNEGTELIVKPEEVRIGVACIEAAMKSAERGESTRVELG
ncbi:MAG: oxidoreductase [Fimbriimonadales bacterium]